MVHRAESIDTVNCFPNLTVFEVAYLEDDFEIM